MKKKVIAGLLSVFSIAMICSVAIPVYVIKHQDQISESPKKSVYVAEDTEHGLYLTLMEFIDKTQNYYKVGVESSSIKYGNGLINSNNPNIKIPDSYPSPDDENIKLPIKEIGDNAFSKTNIKTIEMGKNVTKIGLDAFSKCAALTKVTFTDSIEEIDIGAFRECKQLATVSTGTNTTGVTLPTNDKFTELKSMTFLECEAINTINSFGSIKSIGNSAFDTNKSLKTISSWGNVEKIGTLAFAYCPSISGTIEFNDKLKSIESYAFIGDSKIDQFNFKTKLYIGNNAFRQTDAYGIFEDDADCTSTSSQKNWNDGLKVFKNAKVFETDDARYILYKENNEYKAKLISAKKNSYTVDEVIAILGAQTDNGNTYNVTSTEDNIFKNKIKVNDPSTENTVLDLAATKLESLGASLFEGATCLTKVILPTTLTTISANAFKNCFDSTNNPDVLYKIYINSTSPVTIKANAFEGTNAYALFTAKMCSSNSEAGWNKDLLSYYLAKDFNITSVSINSNSIDNVNIVELTLIDDSKNVLINKINTNDDNKITETDFNDLLTKLTANLTTKIKFDVNLFDGILDSSFTDITITSPITEISDGCFRNNTYLQNVTVNSDVTSIGAGAFAGCENIQSMTLPFIGKEKNDETDLSGRDDDVFGYIFENTNKTDEDSANSKYYVARAKYYGDDAKIKNYRIPKSLQTIVITEEKIINHAAFGELCVDNIVLEQNITKIGKRAFIKFKSEGGHNTSVPTNYLTSYKCLLIHATNLTTIGDYCFSTNGGGDNKSKICFDVTDTVFTAKKITNNYNGNKAKVYYYYDNVVQSNKNCYTVDSDGNITCYESGNKVYP